MRNQCLFQTLEKFQVLQTLNFIQVWHLDLLTRVQIMRLSMYSRDFDQIEIEQWEVIGTLCCFTELCYFKINRFCNLKHEYFKWFFLSFYFLLLIRGSQIYKTKNKLGEHFIKKIANKICKKTKKLKYSNPQKRNIWHRNLETH